MRSNHKYCYHGKINEHIWENNHEMKLTPSNAPNVRHNIRQITTHSSDSTSWFAFRWGKVIILFARDTSTIHSFIHRSSYPLVHICDCVTHLLYSFEIPCSWIDMDAKFTRRWRRSVSLSIAKSITSNSNGKIVEAQRIFKFFVKCRT